MSEEYKKNSKSNAISLAYDPAKMNAPTVTALGSGKIADEMKKVAIKYNVPIRKSSKLSEKLKKVPISKEIPVHLYEEVAKIILSTKKPINKLK